MKKIILTLLLAFSFTSQAGVISTNLGDSQVSLSDTLTVEISGNNFAESDIFWFDFEFDTSIFALNQNSITSSLNIVDRTSGMFDGLEIIEQSFGLGFTFSDFATVAGNFTIARFELTALKDGISNFAVRGIDGFTVDFSTPSYSSTFTNGDSVSVVSSSVSEPKSMMLFMLSLAGLLMVKRKQQNAL